MLLSYILKYFTMLLRKYQKEKLEFLINKNKFYYSLINSCEQIPYY